MNQHNQSSPDYTPRTATLLGAAIDRIVDGEIVVDLGAGRDAGVARAVQRARPRCRVMAVEPQVEVAAPDTIEVVAGEIDSLPPASADVILFNAPNTPDRFVDPRDGSYHQFAGGELGYECLHGVTRAASTRLRPGGRLIFICPTFSPPPDVGAPLELLATYAEPRGPFEARAAVLPRCRPEYREFLDHRLRELEPRWTALGVTNTPDTITAAVLCAARPATDF